VIPIPKKVDFAYVFYLVLLTLFNTGTQNEQIMQNECRSTRFYLVWLIFLIVILTFYYTITSFTLTIISKSPSFAKYSTLIIHFQSQQKIDYNQIFSDFFVYIECAVNYRHLSCLVVDLRIWMAHWLRYIDPPLSFTDILLVWQEHLYLLNINQRKKSKRAVKRMIQKKWDSKGAEKNESTDKKEKVI